MSETINRDESLDVKSAVESRNKELKHGEYVQDEHGRVGIVIDKQVEAESKQPETMKAITRALQEQQDQIEEISRTGGISQFANSEDSKAIEQENLRKLMDSDDPNVVAQAEAMRKLMQESDKWQLSATGIAPTNSRSAKDFQQLVQGSEDGGFDINIDPEELKRQAIQEHEEMKRLEEQAKRAEEEAARLEKEKSDKIAQEIIDNPGEIVNESVDSLQFNVPEGKVQAFISSLPKDTRAKVTRTKSIVVNEVKKKTVPTKVRTITSMNEFRKVLPTKIHSEIEGTVLPNSGYYAIFKGAGSMAMATLIPDRPDQPLDYAKRYQFCYDNLVSTSIGPLSYSEFCAYTALADIDLCLYTILRASEPDDSSVTLICGDKECKTEYQAKYKLSTLLDPDSLTDRLLEQTKRVYDAKDIVDKAKEIFYKSPVMTVKSIDIEREDGDLLTIDLKAPNGTITIERASKMQEIAKRNSQYVSALLVYVPIVYLTTTPDGETEPVTYEISDVDVIAQIISDLDDDALNVLSNVLESIGDYEPPRFSFRGNFECPVCHRHETKIPCTVDSLVFQKVSRAIK